MKKRRTASFVTATLFSILFAFGTQQGVSAASSKEISVPLSVPAAISAGHGDTLAGPTPEVKNSCDETDSQLSKLAAKGVKEAGCITAGKSLPSHQLPPGVHSRADAGSSNKAQGAAVSPVWCLEDGVGSYWITRMTGCIADDPMVFTLRDTKTGEPLGEAQLLYSATTTLNPRTGAITETNYITMLSEVDVPELLITYSGLCDGLCFAENPEAEVDAPLVEGETVSGTTVYSDTPTPGTTDTIRLSNAITATIPLGVPLHPGSVSGAPVIRCDTGVAVTTNTGCAYPEVKPTVLFSLSSTGSTAAIDAWAIENEAPGWGFLTPLTRVPATVGDANRAKICGDGTYQPLYVNDSCEEYPFASTEESGGNNGLTGADCAMVRAVSQNGQWFITELTNVTGNEGCVIGHADITSQNSQGGTVSTFYQQNRVIPTDQYWVGITT